MKDSTKSPPPHLGVAIPSDPDEVYLSAFAEGIRRGLAMAGDPCAQGSRCPTPPPVAPGPLAGAEEKRPPQPPLAGSDPDEEA